MSVDDEEQQQQPLPLTSVTKTKSDSETNNEPSSTYSPNSSKHTAVTATCKPPKYTAVTATRPNSRMATAALVLGVLAILPGCGLSFGALAIFFGWKASDMIRKNPEEFGGTRMAKSGIFLGILMFVKGIIVTYIYVTLVVWATDTANELSENTFDHDNWFYEDDYMHFFHDILSTS